MNQYLVDYKAFCRSTAVYPNKDTGDIREFMYLALGLNGEAGEVAEKIKKAYRDGLGLESFTKETLGEMVLKELGDVLWYAARLADVFGYSLIDVIDANIEKLSARKENQTLHGSGDNR